MEPFLYHNQGYSSEARNNGDLGLSPRNDLKLGSFEINERAIRKRQSP